LINISKLTIDYTIEAPSLSGQVVTEAMVDNDMDLIFVMRAQNNSQGTLNLAVLNKEGCHPDCDGCFEPNNIRRCLRCKTGMRLVEGLCTPVTTPCPPHMNENAFGEC
jgi:hypothetical protein